MNAADVSDRLIVETRLFSSDKKKYLIKKVVAKWFPCDISPCWKVVAKRFTYDLLVVGTFKMQRNRIKTHFKC